MWPFRRTRRQPDDGPAVIRLSFTNDSTQSQTLSLEPLGYYFDFEPGQTHEVLYMLEAESHLAIAVGRDAVGIWDETQANGDGLMLEGHQHWSET